MKKTIVAAALALSFVASAAYAQADTPPPPPKTPPAGGPEAGPPPRHPGPEAMRGPGRHGEWMKHHMMMMMSKGARIRVRDGDIRLNVQCAEADSTADCGQTVIKILKEMQSSDESSFYRDRDDKDSGGDDPMSE